MIEFIRLRIANLMLRNANAARTVRRPSDGRFCDCRPSIRRTSDDGSPTAVFAFQNLSYRTSSKLTRSAFSNARQVYFGSGVDVEAGRGVRFLVRPIAAPDPLPAPLAMAAGAE